MNADKCEQILRVENLLNAFTQNIKEQSDEIFYCLYKCCYDKFIKWAIIRYTEYAEDMITDLSDRAFTDGMLKLQEFTIRKGLYKDKVSSDKIFFRFFKNQLRANITKEMRLTKKNLGLPKDFPAQFSANTQDNAEEFSETKTENQSCLEQSLNQLKNDDRQIVIWRHVEEIGNKEIANRLGITIASATNRIYRCMERVKNLMEKCKQKDHEN
ncbi:MAG TPA: sigma-70 family RNA polymerase sigma factor [Parafilimonas sp.]|nr:sigma-70 family RNA polymerase sigma factor [Parafilimonas sp.]